MQEKIAEIETLKVCDRWGVEYKLWLQDTRKIIAELFEPDYVEIFDSLRTTTTSYIDSNYNQRQYEKELEKRRKFLETMLEKHAKRPHDNDSTVESADNPVDALKEIWKREQHLKENLLTTAEAQQLQDRLLDLLEKTLKPDTTTGLRFRKIKTNKKLFSWWSDTNGYPIDNPWSKFQPFLDLLAQHEAEKTIKRRLETEGLFVETRSRGEDLHLLVGQRDGTGEKAHMIIDGNSGEIRTEDSKQEPTEIAKKIEAILTLPSGKRIKTTREAIEEI